MFRLIARASCPACLLDAGQRTLCDIPYTRLKAFLEKSYVADSIGRHLSSILQNDYVIAECSRCSLIYQKNVPDSDSMKILYSEMICPDETFDRHRLHMDDLAYYDRHVRDVFSVFARLRGECGEDKPIFILWIIQPGDGQEHPEMPRRTQGRPNVAFVG